MSGFLTITLLFVLYRVVLALAFGLGFGLLLRHVFGPRALAGATLVARETPTLVAVLAAFIPERLPHIDRPLNAHRSG